MKASDRKILERRLENLKSYRVYFNRQIIQCRAILDSDPDLTEAVYAKIEDINRILDVLHTDIEKLTILLRD